jgi:hypothetical protein
MTARRLELRHEWGHHALWDLDRDEDIDPATLDIPASVIVRLGAFASRWDSTFDVSHPDEPRVEQFVVDELGHEGARLWRALLGLLPPADFTITYQHDGVRYREASELPVEWRFG